MNDLATVLAFVVAGSVVAAILAAFFFDRSRTPRRRERGHSDSAAVDAGVLAIAASAGATHAASHGGHVDVGGAVDAGSVDCGSVDAGSCDGGGAD